MATRAPQTGRVAVFIASFSKETIAKGSISSAVKLRICVRASVSESGAFQRGSIHWQHSPVSPSVNRL